MPKFIYRHWGHIVLGAGLPWLVPGDRLPLTFLFCLYEYLQFKHLTKRGDTKKDDSYLDVYEVAVWYAVSAGIRWIAGV